MSIETLADWYMDSEWPDKLMLTSRKLGNFIMNDERVSSAWEEDQLPEFERLLDLVIERERQRDKAQESGPS